MGKLFVLIGIAVIVANDVMIKAKEDEEKYARHPEVIKNVFQSRSYRYLSERKVNNLKSKRLSGRVSSIESTNAL